MANFQSSPCYSARFVAALQYAADIHSKQIRKQGNVPYVSHLLQVCGLVLEAGGSEDEAIAALLHDAVEDAGVSLEDLPFGYEVAHIVGNLTERKETPKEQRKAEYVWFVSESVDSVKLVSCADKLHNLRSYATDGKHLWKADTAEFYRCLLPIYEGCDRIPRHWIAEMQQLLAGMQEEMKIISKSKYESLQYWASRHDWDREFPDHNRSCNCGSGESWINCSANSQYCG